MLFVDASKEYEKQGNKNYLLPPYQDRIAEAVAQREDIPYFTKLVTNADIIANNCNLSVSSYVEQPDTREKVEIDALNEEIKEIVKRGVELRGEIDRMVAELEGGKGVMNRVEELIQQLCPNGVEWKKLGDYIELYTGEQLNKDAMLSDGVYPVMNGGVLASGFTDSFNEEADTITISQGGASAGFVNWMESKFWAGAHCFIVKVINDKIINRYLYFFLKNSERKMMLSKYGAGIPSLSKESVNKLLIPIPPLPIQQDIVRILDTFTELTANLQTELEARRKQYEYYRDKLLTFDRV